MTLYKKQTKTSASEAFLASLNADYATKENPFLTEAAYVAITTDITAINASIASILNTITNISNTLAANDARQIPITLTDGVTISWNVRLNYNSKVTLGGNRTLAITNLLPGDYGTIEIIQGVGGNHTLALPAGSIVGNTGAGVLGLSTAAGSIDVATFYYNGTVLEWTITPKFT